jgi:hypothetical protein
MAILTEETALATMTGLVAPAYKRRLAALRLASPRSSGVHQEVAKRWLLNNPSTIKKGTIMTEPLSVAIEDLKNTEDTEVASMDVAADQDGIAIQAVANEPKMDKSKFALRLDKIKKEREERLIAENNAFFVKVGDKAEDLPPALQDAYVDVVEGSLGVFDQVMGAIAEKLTDFFFSAIDKLKDIVNAIVDNVKKIANAVVNGVKKVGNWFKHLFGSVAIGAVLLESGVLNAGLPVQVAIGGEATVLVYDTGSGSMTEMTEYNPHLSKHLTYSAHEEHMAISHAVHDKDGMIVQLLTNSEVGGKYMFWVHSIGKK